MKYLGQKRPESDVNSVVLARTSQLSNEPSAANKELLEDDAARPEQDNKLNFYLTTDPQLYYRFQLTEFIFRYNLLPDSSDKLNVLIQEVLTIHDPKKLASFIVNRKADSDIARLGISRYLQNYMLEIPENQHYSLAVALQQQLGTRNT